MLVLLSYKQPQDIPKSYSNVFKQIKEPTLRMVLLFVENLNVTLLLVIVNTSIKY